MKKFLYLVATDRIGGGAVTLLKGILWCLSQVYRLILSLRKVIYSIGLFKRHQLACPVISVGNLTMGGSGKTPLVAFIARTLKEKGVQPVILIRGYMGERANARSQDSDEAVMLEHMLPGIPVLAGPDRVRNARDFLSQNKADVFLLDDGFQHWPLARDIDIVMIDATNPWGNGCLLPRGILREPKNALLRARIFVLTKTDLGAGHVPKIKNDLSLINPEALIVETVHKPVSLDDMRSGAAMDLASIRGQKVCAVCSIGDPGSFTKTLTGLGVNIDVSFAFMDHHNYKRADIKQIIQSCDDREIATIVTTAKDAVKLKPFLGAFAEHMRILSLGIKISMTHGKETFLERIHRLL